MPRAGRQAAARLPTGFTRAPVRRRCGTYLAETAARQSTARRSPRPTRNVARRHTARPPDAPRRAVSLNAGDYLADATALAGAGELEAAIQALRRSLFLDHTLVGARFLLAHALERAGRRDEAVGEYTAVVRALAAEDPDAPVPGADGFSAGTLLDAARRALGGRVEH